MNNNLNRPFVSLVKIKEREKENKCVYAYTEEA